MARARSVAAVLPALLPGLLVVLLGFQSGGFYPASWAPVALVLAVALALRVVVAERPLEGFGPWTAISACALASLGVWMLLSSSWSSAPGRATLEFVRLLTYLLVLVLCASLASDERRLGWAIRGVVIAIGVICVAGLASRLRPDLLNGTGLVAGRLDYPITYWNGMGLLAGIGGLLALHLSASRREGWPVRVMAAGMVPLAAVTLYFTLSRGGIAATVAGVVIYVIAGFSRGTPAALLAVGPPTYAALASAYGAERLVTAGYADAAGRAQGREVLGTLAICVVVAVVLRAAALVVDRLVDGVPGAGRIPVTARVGIGVAAAAVVVAVALAAGAPAFAERQADRFLEPVMITDGADPRQRLTKVTSNGRVDHWKVSLRTFRDDPLKGSGAGTYQNAWNRWRELNFQVLDSHSLYLETLGELGLVGLGLLAVAMITLLVGLAWRLRGPGRVDVAAVLAATAAWAVHAGVDWDWELTAVSAWLFGLCGLALARRPVEATNLGPARLVRVVAALGCLVLALLPAAVWRSQVRLQEAADAFRRGDCPATIDAGLNSLDALGARAEPWELIAYCNVRLGQPVLAEGAARAAIARDPDNWEYHYALAIVRGVFGKDPRPAAAAALRLNPLEERTTQASRAFRTSRPRLWERRARRLPLYLR